MLVISELDCQLDTRASPAARVHRADPPAGGITSEIIQLAVYRPVKFSLRIGRAIGIRGTRQIRGSRRIDSGAKVSPRFSTVEFIAERDYSTPLSLRAQRWAVKRDKKQRDGKTRMTIIRMVNWILCKATIAANAHVSSRISRKCFKVHFLKCIYDTQGGGGDNGRMLRAYLVKRLCSPRKDGLLRAIDGNAWTRTFFSRGVCMIFGTLYVNSGRGSLHGKINRERGIIPSVRVSKSILNSVISALQKGLHEQTESQTKNLCP